jgi:ABC-type antimicrobial peptide transport system permease subunit
MTWGTLIRRSLRFHARAHAGVVLGAVIGSAALTGALLVGDSVNESLRERALQRLANTYFAMAPADRTFSSDRIPANPVFRGTGSRSNETEALLPFAPATAILGQRAPQWEAKALVLPGTASLPSGAARANHVQVYGVDEAFWEFVDASAIEAFPTNSLILNETLASQLGARKGDEVVLRVNRPSAFSREAAVAPRGDQTAALRLKLAGVLSAASGGDLALQSGGTPPLNAFVPIDALSASVRLPDRANLCLAGPVGKRMHTGPIAFARIVSDVRLLWYRYVLRRPYLARHQLASPEESLSFLGEQLQEHWNLADAELDLEYAPVPFGLGLRSKRVFLEQPVVAAAERLEGTNCHFILTYLANLISAGTNSTPYSMVTAAGPPYTPPAMQDDEIVINQWLADDLLAVPGDRIVLSYFDPESGAKLLEHTNIFRLRSIVPLASPWSDRTLMPDFTGIENAESARDWDAGFPLTYTIRPKDEDYWKKYRGTPKAFVTLAAGQKMWANRFGQATAIRFLDPPDMPTAEHWGRFKVKVLASLKPEALGLRFEPVREQALKAAAQSQDFGQLFLGFSIFLVAAALLLMALLFQFALEQRAAEVGTLLALGFTARRVRRLLLFEGAALALVGGVLGALGGLGYAKAMVWGLTTVWRSAVGSSVLQFHATASSLVLGASASTLVACLVIWLTLRKQARQPTTELLAGQVQIPRLKRRSRGGWIALAAGCAAIATIAWAFVSGETANAEAFFSAGSLLLIAGLALSAAWMTALARRASAVHLTVRSLGVRGCARRRNRSLATMALLASGCFVVVAIGVFRLDANRDALRRTSGTGGFSLLGESTIPVVQDLNTRAGRDAFGLDANDLAGVSFVPMRVHDGDEASCLNLNRAQKPRLLGVNPKLLEGRFTFASTMRGLDAHLGWQLLKSQQATSNLHPADEVPAIGDANSIQWALGKKIGDTIDYTDDQGRAFKVRLVGAVANSILQGSLLIDEAEFVRHFPGESGYRMFLIDVPSNRVTQISVTLSRALQDVGLELTSTVRRLNAFNAVQNTYLGTFQVLGGLGLLLGSAGLGVVVLRNLLERRGELGLLVALGFRRGLLERLVFAEHGALLGLGLGIGIVAAAVAVLPALLSSGAQLPYVSLGLTLGAVLFNGALWTWLAIRYALRGNLLEALRNE